MSYKNGLIEDLTYDGKVKEIERKLPYQDYLNVSYEDFHSQFKEKCVEWNKKETPWTEIEEWIHDKIRMDDMLKEHLFKRIVELNLNIEEINSSVGEVCINASITNGIFVEITVKDKY